MFFIRAKIAMPTYLTQEAQYLLRCLFKRNPANRLGSGPNGGKDITDHPFFATIDFEKLNRREVTPPYIPTVVKNDSLFHFDKDMISKLQEGRIRLFLTLFNLPLIISIFKYRFSRSSSKCQCS